ncbi:hypothetical protein [Vreelandella neptunia]|uniref:Uncharacterized protein n=1 Tax=Vreelandella neptunia TaxID=115551 RepID=A0ABZ0YRG8_9GAMM|nr:hypothetical protein [Halomonas neptunia]MDN3561671.1 hypothetical protein [Halomonas neptunia]WQH14573.1 hypothetical protein SR894_08550 [Halomonas neptunia]
MSNLSQPTQVKAYHVQEDYEATCVIVFDTNGASARRRGAGELGVEWESIEFCRRAHWADQYASTGLIPPMAMVEQGWRLSCGHCCQEISQDLIEDPESDVLPVVIADWIYCNQACHDSEVTERQQKQDAEIAALDTAKAKFPGAEVFGYYQDSERRDAVLVKAPGTQRSARWVIGADTVSTAECDKEAWIAYAASIKEAGQ